MRAAILLSLLLICPPLTVEGTDCTASADASPHVAIADVRARLMESSWPTPPPGARIEGYAVFQIRVSVDGRVSCASSVGGHPFLLSVLTPRVHAWKFRPGPSFVGIVVIRYSSVGFELL
jgi:hypothetical protein